MKNPPIRPLLAGLCLTLTSGVALADAMTIVDDNVGVGTSSPTGSIHILRDATSADPKPSVVMETVGNANAAKWEIKTNETTGRMTFKDLNGTSGPGGGPTTPFKFAPTAIENLLRIGIPAIDTVSISGKLVIAGTCTANGSGPCADYVFEEGYELRPLDEVAAFIDENGHLPNIPSADDMKKNGVDMTHLSGRLLEKVEELTLYTLDQESTIERLEAMVERQSALAEEQRVRIEKLESVVQ